MMLGIGEITSSLALKICAGVKDFERNTRAGNFVGTLAPAEVNGVQARPTC
jgi:hypothetical protein